MIYPTSSDFYREVLSALCAAIGDREYFSGTISGTFETKNPVQATSLACLPREVDWRLTLSVIVYTQEQGQLPAGICNLVPVWWELHTFTEQGEIRNDFSFSELRACLN